MNEEFFIKMLSIDENKKINSIKLRNGNTLSIIKFKPHKYILIMKGFSLWELGPCVVYYFNVPNEPKIFSFYNPVGIFVYCIIPLILIPFTNIGNPFLIGFSIIIFLIQTLFLRFVIGLTERKINEIIEDKKM